MRQDFIVFFTPAMAYRHWNDTAPGGARVLASKRYFVHIGYLQFCIAFEIQSRKFSMLDSSK